MRARRELCLGGWEQLGKDGERMSVRLSNPFPISVSRVSVVNCAVCLVFPTVHVYILDGSHFHLSSLSFLAAQPAQPSPHMAGFVLIRNLTFFLHFLCVTLFVNDLAL